jgi:hypothetical protein
LSPAYWSFAPSRNPDLGYDTHAQDPPVHGGKPMDVSRQRTFGTPAVAQSATVVQAWNSLQTQVRHARPA